MWCTTCSIYFRGCFYQEHISLIFMGVKNRSFYAQKFTFCLNFIHFSFVIITKPFMNNCRVNSKNLYIVATGYIWGFLALAAAWTLFLISCGGLVEQTQKKNTSGDKRGWVKSIRKVDTQEQECSTDVESLTFGRRLLAQRADSGQRYSSLKYIANLGAHNRRGIRWFSLFYSLRWHMNMLTWWKNHPYACHPCFD